MNQNSSDIRQFFFRKKEECNELINQEQELCVKKNLLNEEISGIARTILLEEKWLSKLNWILEYSEYSGFYLKINFGDDALDLHQHFDFFDLLDACSLIHLDEFSLVPGVNLYRSAELKITWTDSVVAISFFKEHNLKIDCSRVRKEIEILKNKLATFESFMASFNTTNERST